MIYSADVRCEEAPNACIEEITGGHLDVTSDDCPGKG